MKVICFGSSGKDIFFPTDEGKIIETPEDILSQKKISFELGAKYAIKERFETLGGCAANAAAGLSKNGIGVACASSVGGDSIGAWIQDELKKNNIDTSLINIEESKKSNFSAIIVDKNSADRVIFSSRDSSGESKINADNISGADWFFVSDIQGKWEDQLEKVFEMAKASNKKIAFNPREAGIHEDAAEIIEAAGLSEILFVNKDEATEIVCNIHGETSQENIKDEKYLLQKLKGLETKVVVITDGLRGAWVINGEEMFFAQALQVKAVDSTGAGDAFSSGFLSAYIKGKSPEECLRWGIANSASVVQFYGGVEGLLNENEIAKRSEEIKTEKL